MSRSPASAQPPSPRWYAGIGRYEWLVLVIASLGWMFDVFEGQVFVASMNEVWKDLLPPQTPDGTRRFFDHLALGAFLAGGALGGVLFGALGDRIGRARTMILTILLYSVFAGLTALARTWWEVVLLRFLVALGVGGEWAVASAMVAEVFPPRARAWSGAIFHGSSVLGTYLAVAAGQWIVSDPRLGWRWAFAVGALPAVLTLWIRWQLQEPQAWLAARTQRGVAERAGRLAELFAGEVGRRTALGFLLAVVGLATFWGVHIYGREFARRRAEQAMAEASQQPRASQELAAHLEGRAAQTPSAEVSRRLKQQEMLGMFLTTTGGGLGLVAFGPICEWLGRRRAFILFHLSGLVMGVLMFQTYPRYSDGLFAGLLVLFGFATLGMHAGYAIYFPELYPTHLRSLGAGFCFNFARVTTAVMLVVHGTLQRAGVSFEASGTLLSLLFLLGVAIVWFGPETKGTALA